MRKAGVTALILAALIMLAACAGEPATPWAEATESAVESKPRREPWQEPQKEPEVPEKAALRHTRFGGHDIYMDVSEVESIEPDEEYGYRFKGLYPEIYAEDSGAYRLKLNPDYGGAWQDERGFELTGLEEYLWYDEHVAVMFSMDDTLTLFPIAFEMPEEYRIISAADGFLVDNCFGIIYSTEENAGTAYYFQAQSNEGELLFKSRLRNDFIAAGERHSQTEFFDYDRVVYQTEDGPYQIAFNTGEQSRYKGEYAAELPGGWTLGAIQDDSHSPWVYTLYDGRGEPYGKPLTLDFASTSFEAHHSLSSPSGNVYWKAGGARVVTVTNGIVYCHMNFDEGTHAYERIYDAKAFTRAVTASADGRFGVYHTAFAGAGDGNWHDAVLLDATDGSTTYLYEGSGQDRSLFGQGYRLFIEDTMKIINAETNTVIAEIPLPKNTVTNASCYDSESDCFVVATTVDYNPGAMLDMVISQVTLYVIDGNGRILRTVETGMETIPYKMYSVNSLDMELDGHGYAVIEDGTRVYYR